MDRIDGGWRLNLPHPDAPAGRVLALLENVTPEGDGWRAICPAHDDGKPSLRVTEGGDGRALLHCRAGCPTPAVVAAVGLTMADLMPDDGRPARGRAAPPPARKAPAPRATEREARKPRKAARSYRDADAARAAAERSVGRPADHAWPYLDAASEPVGLVLRWDAHGENDKTLRPLRADPDGWRCQAPDAPRPLLYLPELLADPVAEVYVVEGEATADAVRSLGLPATTNAGGASAWRLTDWAPLAGRDVVLLPDHDDAGNTYAENVAAHLLALTPPARVRVVRLVDGWPELPAKGDAVDVLHLAGGDLDAVRATLAALLDETPPAVNETETPAHAAAAGGFVGDAAPFPVEVLPPPLANLVNEGAAAQRCAPSMIALPALAAAAACIGNARRVEARSDWTEPAVLWPVVVAESGAGKTPAFNLAMEPLRAMEREAYAQHQADRAAWEAARTGRDAGDDDAPGAPRAERLVVDDATVEALLAVLDHNPRGLLVARAELASWAKGMNAYKGGKGSDRETWLEFHDAGQVSIDRKGKGEHRLLPRAAVCLTGTVQPSILAGILGAEEHESGLAARLLLAMPDPTTPRFDTTPVSEKTRTRYAATLRHLRGLPMGGDDGTEPRRVPLTGDARAIYGAFHDAFADEGSNMPEPLRTAYPKLRGAALRLALVLHLARSAAGDAEPDAVDGRSMADAITLTRWFTNEARRVYARLRETPGDAALRELVDRVRRRGGSMSGSELVRAVREVENVADAEARLETIAAAGLGRWVTPPQPGKAGGRPPARRMTLNAPPSTKPRPTDPPPGV